jgi:hypothetical protein
VLFLDPDWFFWAFDGTVLTGAFEADASRVYERATQIRIPHEPGEDLVARYWIDPHSDRFTRLEIIPASRPLHIGSSIEVRLEYIDLAFAFCTAKYDKKGNRMLVAAAREILGLPAKMTRERCEAFFDDDRNFHVERATEGEAAEPSASTPPAE